MLRRYSSNSNSLSVKVLIFFVWTLNYSSPGALVIDSIAFDRLVYFQDNSYEKATIREYIQIYWRLLLWADLLLVL
jgi:hypothetical protein